MLLFCAPRASGYPEPSRSLSVFAAWGLVSAFMPLFCVAFYFAETQTALLVALPVLLGALVRVVVGMLAGRFDRGAGSSSRSWWNPLTGRAKVR